ncbi:pyruvate ferredoxin oxidoreductase alpha subunit, partial [Candidatus Hakubella thermalkaliphila]
MGIISPNVIRPFPAEEIRKALERVKAVLIADRADSYGAHGGNMALEVKAALKDDPQSRTLCLARVYGLGGKDFYTEDAEELLRQALQAAQTWQVEIPFDYHGANPGHPDPKLE